MAIIAGHGHVLKNDDGSKVRCGGPRFCHVCKQELNRLGGGDSSGTQLDSRQLEMCFDEPACQIHVKRVIKRGPTIPRLEKHCLVYCGAACDCGLSRRGIGS